MRAVHKRLKLSIAAALVLAAPTCALAQDAAALVGNTLAGAGPSPVEWTAYFAPDGTVYTWNSATGEFIAEPFAVEEGRLCYVQQERCWDVVVHEQQVTVSAPADGTLTLWTLEEGDAHGLVALAERTCVHRHDGPNGEVSHCT